MRTTLNIQDDLMRRVKKHAAETGTTLTEIVEQALRAAVAGQAPRRNVHLRVETGPGPHPPRIDLADRDSLYEVMERPE